MRWVHTTTLEMVRASPTKMKERYPAETFIDANGKAQDSLNWLLQPDESAVTDANGTIIVPQKYRKLSARAVLEMTKAEKDSVDAAAAASAKAEVIADSKAGYDTYSGRSEYELVRALAQVMTDEVNILRAAAVPPMPARTLAQLKNAIEAKLDTF